MQVYMPHVFAQVDYWGSLLAYSKTPGGVGMGLLSDVHRYVVGVNGDSHLTKASSDLPTKFAKSLMRKGAAGTSSVGSLHWMELTELLAALVRTGLRHSGKR